MTGLPRLSSSSGYKVVLFTDFCRLLAQALNINTLHDVYVVEELIRLTYVGHHRIIPPIFCFTFKYLLSSIANEYFIFTRDV